MEWNTIWGKSGCIDMGFVQIPTYQLSERDVILFDSGIDFKEELPALMEQRGLRVRAVFCTHMHWDHTAGNEGLVNRFGAEIFAHEDAIADIKFSKTPTYPIRALREEGSVTVDGVEIEILPTPGHCVGHLAFVTPDGVCCLGDAMMSGQMLRESKMPYLEDVDLSIVTMEQIRRTRYPFYATSHKGVTPLEDMPALVDENIKKELDLYDMLRQQITGPKPVEEVLAGLAEAAGIRRNRGTDYIRGLGQARLDVLVKAGEYYLEHDMVIPR